MVVIDEDEGEDGVVCYLFEFSSLDVFVINEIFGVIFVNKLFEEVDSLRCRWRSVDLVDEELIGLCWRVKREVGVIMVMLCVRVDSGKVKLKVGLVWVDIGIDFVCFGCLIIGVRDDEGGIVGSILFIIIVLVVLVGVILIVFIVVMVIIYMRKKKKRNW